MNKLLYARDVSKKDRMISDQLFVSLYKYIQYLSIPLNAADLISSEPFSRHSLMYCVVNCIVELVCNCTHREML